MFASLVLVQLANAFAGGMYSSSDTRSSSTTIQVMSAYILEVLQIDFYSLQDDNACFLTRRGITFVEW